MKRKKKQGMNARERLLAFGLAGAVGIWFLGPGVWSFFATPLENRWSDVEKLQESVELRELEEFQTTSDERRLRSWGVRSLPPDPLDAQRTYLAWIDDLVAESGFETFTTQPAAPVRFGDVYATVSVDVQGEATFDAVSQFLFHAQRANLMHRVASLHLTSTGRSANDPVEVHVVVEGFALLSAPPKSVLFPTTILAAPLDGSANTLRVGETKGFPSKPGFEIRIDGEYARVTELDGSTWTIDRGLHRSRTRGHDEGTRLQYVNVVPEWREVTFDEFTERLREHNPFALPRQYEPRVSPPRDVTIVRGETATTRVRASGYDSTLGTPAFRLAGKPQPGMTLDESSGEFRWSPGEDVPADDYEVQLAVTVPGLPEPVTESFSVTLREPNASPVLGELDSFQVTQGGVLRFTATAEDADDDGLRFSLSDAPSGASIDAETGEFSWSVPTDFEPGEQRIEVRVEDDRRASDRRTVTVTVREDTARSIFLVGAINRGGDREAWLLNRKTGEKSVLKEGLPAEVGGVPSFVLVIGRDFVLLQQDDTTYRLDLGHSLEDLVEQRDEAG